ncbi:MAG TPA: 50S ribosomal protein L25 [Candidatus Wolfebacteria bacterium]|nr:50S ribosomal protein L25 [Candidatus Wolfebacteria bacterium]
MELGVQKREIFGKKVKALREQELIPAELYGHGFENLHLSVSAKNFSRVFKEAGESTVIKLKVEGGDEKEKSSELNVLIHDIQKNALTDEISHIDFYQVRMDEKIKTTVPLIFVGEAPGVKEKGGILIKAVKEIEVESLPADLPNNISINIDVLDDIGKSIHMKDIKIDEKVKVLIDAETVITTITEPAKEEEKAEEVSVEDVKVEGEEEKEKKEREETTEEKKKEGK